MQKYLFKSIRVVNEGKITETDVLVKDGIIAKIGTNISESGITREINGEGKYLFPGVIDDQVHFREPGLTHKASIASESRAAVAGGTTSFMEMPNTIPNALTLELLEEKYTIAANSSAANYSFYMGVSNTNADEVLRAAEFRKSICGLKIFMGSSTGNMLVDNHSTLNRIFSESGMLIATHCEDERIIRRNYDQLKATKINLEPSDHPIIRDEEACFESSLVAIQFAKKYDSRLHILHISTEKELQLFSNMLPLKDKRITAEVCVHHLHFTAQDYETLGYKIKCNPAIKAPHNKAALWVALNDDRLDVIATDHAPHLLTEKEGPYEHAHAGLPLVQHSLLLMLQHHLAGDISLEKIAEKMSHAVADCFGIKDRGYIKEGYHADLVMVDLNGSHLVSRENLLYKCGWSPLEGFNFSANIEATMVNGNIVYENGIVNDSYRGKRLLFNW
jgi:dihydroorotase